MFYSLRLDTKSENMHKIKEKLSLGCIPGPTLGFFEKFLHPLPSTFSMLEVSG